MSVGLASVCTAQKDSGYTLKFGGYVDAYYARYTDSVGSGKVERFGAVSPFSNNFGVNIAQVSAQYNSNRIRSTITLQYGDLPAAAWLPVYNFIQEANVGVKLSKKFWLDAGFFKTHIGTEALLPKDNICSSVSIITFYEPWWQSGMRLTYTPNDKFTGALYIVNGYNEFVATNKKKASWFSFSYNFSDYFNIGYYDLLSNSNPDADTSSYWRFLNNLVFNIGLGKKVKLIIGADYIVELKASLEDDYLIQPSSTAAVYSLITTLKYQATEKFAIYGRFEYFNDADGMLSGLIINFNGSLTGFKLMGETIGLEFKPTANSYIRLEGREIEMNELQRLFYYNGEFYSYRGEAMLNIGISF